MGKYDDKLTAKDKKDIEAAASDAFSQKIKGLQTERWRLLALPMRTAEEQAAVEGIERQLDALVPPPST